MTDEVWYCPEKDVLGIKLNEALVMVHYGVVYTDYKIEGLSIAWPVVWNEWIYIGEL